MCQGKEVAVCPRKASASARVDVLATPALCPNAESLNDSHPHIGKNCKISRNFGRKFDGSSVSRDITISERRCLSTTPTRHSWTMSPEDFAKYQHFAHASKQRTRLCCVKRSWPTRSKSKTNFTISDLCVRVSTVQSWPTTKCPSMCYRGLPPSQFGLADGYHRQKLLDPVHDLADDEGV